MEHEAIPKYNCRSRLPSSLVASAIIFLIQVKAWEKTQSLFARFFLLAIKEWSLLSFLSSYVVDEPLSALRHSVLWQH